MKKKLIITTLILSILFSLNCFNVYAATLSKSVLQESILKFFDGRMAASAVIKNPNINEGYRNCYIGVKENTSREKKLFIDIAAFHYQDLDAIDADSTDNETFSMTDNTITFKNSLYIYEFNYSIDEENNTVEFTIPVTILQSDKPDTAKNKYIVPEHLLSLLFLSAFESTDFRLDNALYYYEESKSEVSNKVIQDEQIYFPGEVDKNNPVKIVEFMFEDGYFPNVNTTVYSKKYEVLESTDSKFRYNISLKINLSNFMDVISRRIEFVDEALEETPQEEAPSDVPFLVPDRMVFPMLMGNILRHIILMLLK